MRKCTLVLMLLVVLGWAAGAGAQQATPPAGTTQPPPNPAANMEQMGQVFGQIMQNMQDKGIDPRELFGQIRQGMEDGTLDEAGVEKLMIEKGIMDQAMVTQLKTLRDTMQQAQLAGLKAQLQATDDEWRLLLPAIQKVIKAQAALGAGGRIGGGGMGPMGGMMLGGGGGAPELSKAMGELRKTLRDPAAKPETLAAKLKQVRAAREKAKADLAAAQKELTEMLSVRQEGILSGMGML